MISQAQLSLLTNKSLSVSSVNRALQRLNITLKQPCFSPSARNNFGYRVARVVWGLVIKPITQDPNTLFLFVDEAGIGPIQRRKARGFLSIIPCTNKPGQSKNISVLACVIPHFGVINRFYSDAIKSDDYVQFLREVAYIVRRYICNQKTQIIVINDNASIHLTKKVENIAEKYNLNLFYTVPYSPQTNLVVENFFSQMKFNAVYRFSSKPNEPPCLTAPIQHSLPPLKTHIIQQWIDEVVTHYKSETSANVYGAWLKVVEECIKGKSLTGMHYDIIEHYKPEELYHTLICYRVN